MMKLPLLAGLVALLVLGCSTSPSTLPADAAVGVADASTGACPTSIQVDPARVDRRLNAADPVPSPTFGGNGYGMQVLPAAGNWDGRKIAENLTTGTVNDWYFAKLPANLKNVPICPFNAGLDAARARNCGARSDVFTVGSPGDPPGPQPALHNHFWDSHFMFADFDMIGRFQQQVPNLGERCLMLCAQFYECNRPGGTRLPLNFGIVLDVQHVANGKPARTDVFPYKLDSNGGVN